MSPVLPPEDRGEYKGVEFRIVEIPEVWQLFFVLIAVWPFRAVNPHLTSPDLQGRNWGCPRHG